LYVAAQGEPEGFINEIAPGGTGGTTDKDTVHNMLSRIALFFYG
jgi:hypothetical protein